MSSQTRRDRPSTTCRQCNRRKVKCDRISLTRPTCAHCAKARITCIYVDDESRRGSHTFEFIDETSRTAAEASGVSSRDRSQDIPNGAPIIGHLSQQPGGRLRYVEPSFWAFNKEETEPLDTLLASMNRYDIQDPNNDKNEDLESPQPSRGSPASGSANAPRPTVPYRLTGDLTSPSPAWTPAQLSTSRFQRQATNPLSYLPSKAICDRLFAFYLEGYHCILPMVHAPSFKKEYASIWDRQPNNQKTMHFITLLLAILFAGAVTCPNRALISDITSPDETPESLATAIREKGLKALSQSNFPKTPTLETITAYIILQVTWMKEEEPLTTCAFVGLAYRVSQMLGLHHDPSHFSSLSKVVCETRRRLWWTIVKADVGVALAAGLPPMIDLSTCDVKAVSEVSEELFDAPEGSLGKIKEDSVAGLLFSGEILDILTTRDVLSRIYGHQALSRQDIISMRARCRALTADLASKIKRIPKTSLERIDTIPVSYDMASEKSPRNLQAYTRLFFSAMIDKTWFLACHPVLKEAIHELWRELYPSALEHCRDFLYKVAQLSCFEEFQLFQWLWPGCRQPLHAIITLLHSLLRFPQSALAPSFRHALNTIFALCGPKFTTGILAPSSAPSSPLSTPQSSTRQRPLTEGGIECWTLLWRMRARAWTAANLDPDQIPTREQALETLYALYQRPEWDQGQMLAEDPDPKSNRPKSERTTSQESGSGSGSSYTSFNMNMGGGMPPQPPQAQSQNMFAVAPEATPFHAISHLPPPGSLGRDVGALGGMGGSGAGTLGGGTGGEALSDPNLPAPNVDLMFWDQMLQDGYYGHEQAHAGEVYGMENQNMGFGLEGSVDFEGGRGGGLYSGDSGGGRRGSRMEGNIDFQGGGRGPMQ